MLLAQPVYLPERLLGHVYAYRRFDEDQVGAHVVEVQTYSPTRVGGEEKLAV